MTIQIEINNPHYRRTVEEMAAAVGVEVQTLCAGIVEKAVDDYNLEVGAFIRANVMGRLPEDLVKRIGEREE